MRLRRVGRALGLLVAISSSLLAQQPRRPAGAAAPAGSARGTVTGVVYDSLARQALEGARVYVAGTSIAASTDAGGRFRLDSVPAGPQVVFFEHPELDSIGLTAGPRRIDVAPGRLTTLELAMPSLGTLRRSLCTRPPEPGEQPGIVFGTLLDPGSGARLRGGRIIVRWTTAGTDARGALSVERPTITATTDSIGNYYLCGVPTQYVVTMTGQAGRFFSGITELLLGDRGVARRDIAVSRDSMAGAADSLGQRGRATIIGRVLDEHDLPRPSARASVDDAATPETFTDENGRFVLNGLPAGSQTLMVRMIGYSATRLPLLLRNDDTVRLTVHVRSLTVLDTIRITAQSRMNTILLDELQSRMRLGTAGYFLMGEDVKRRATMRSVFSGLPSLVIEGRTVYNFTMQVYSNGRYKPVNLFVDGRIADTQSVQSYRPDQIIAVEWYPRGATAPLRYQTTGDADAPILLVWTRFIR